MNSKRALFICTKKKMMINNIIGWAHVSLVPRPSFTAVRACVLEPGDEARQTFVHSIKFVIGS